MIFLSFWVSHKVYFLMENNFIYFFLCQVITILSVCAVTTVAWCGKDHDSRSCPFPLGEAFGKVLKKQLLNFTEHNDDKRCWP